MRIGMKKRVKLKGRLKIYMQISMYLGLLLLLVDIGIYFLDTRAGFLLTCFLVFYFAMILYLMLYNRPIIINELVSFATQYGQIQKELLRELSVPYSLLDEDGKIIWYNHAFARAIHNEKAQRRSVTSFFSSVTRDRLPSVEEGVAEFEISYEESEYIAKFTRISLREMADDSDIIGEEEYQGCLYAMYLFDETALKIALKENDDQSLAVGMIYLDNYDEALESVEEVRRSLLIALIDRKVNKYISGFDGICKKIEKDKYLTILRKSAVTQMSDKRFELLEDVKTVNIGNEMAVTISIGVGLDGLSYSQNYEFSRMPLIWPLDGAAIRPLSRRRSKSATMVGRASRWRRTPESRPGSRRMRCGKLLQARTGSLSWAIRSGMWTASARLLVFTGLQGRWIARRRSLSTKSPPPYSR